LQKVENWGADAEGKLVLEETLDMNEINKFMNPLLHDQGACRKYLCDHQHFDARTKPWMTGPPPDVDYSNATNVQQTRLSSPLHLWFHTLMEVDKEYSIAVNLTHWEKEKVGPLLRNWKKGLLMRNTLAAIQEGLAKEEDLLKFKR
jgi:hypothetical protein